VSSGFWNVRGWNGNQSSDNYLLRAQCINHLDHDIIGIAETHLLRSESINLQGYTWFGNNRKYIHKNANHGSGGVGFLIKNTLLQDFEISILNESHEGILWLQMKHKTDEFLLLPCVCYLPPENSSRHSDVNSFFDTLLENMYEYQNKGTAFICGDLNSRCGENEDFIAGVDSIPHRHVVDFKSNAYGDHLIQFLIDSNMCMLNGRNFVQNDFTSVSTKGCSVVDYCLLSHDNLQIFTDFKVTHVSDVLNSIGISNATARNVPDHSILTWNVGIPAVLCSTSTDTESAPSFDKFELNNLPDYFLADNSTLTAVNSLIDTLEQGFRTQSELDTAYNGWCDIIKHDMYSKLPFKTVTPGASSSKRYRKGKQWWNDQLTELWKTLHTAEQAWLKCSSRSQKNILKQKYISLRRRFDREVQRCKRFYWFKTQNELLSNLEENNDQFWKSIGKLGIVSDRNKGIPMQVVLENGTVSDNVKTVLAKWQKDFCLLLNTDTVVNNASIGNTQTNNNHDLDKDINILEIVKAVETAKRGKAAGIDLIPSEVLKNDTSVLVLHSLFNVCFQTGQIPSLWSKSIINPIPKSGNKDARDPMSYRGISLAATMYKMYTSLLNERIVKWSDANELIVEEQNGFRKKRSTIDHLASLSNIIDTRKRNKKSTFCAFIDFRKAFDSIDRNLLWCKLNNMGMSTKMLSAIKSLYSNVSSCVRVNGYFTEWFNVNTGLRQGCSLSTVLFNLFINDLAALVKGLHKGVDIGTEYVSILLYADDIVLIAENEDDLQSMLTVLNDWCNSNGMMVNASKSNVVHFRPCSVERSNYVFVCGQTAIEYASKYMYLGILLTEHLDFSLTAKCVAQSAGRALGLLIAKFRNCGGLPYDVYTKLYTTCVVPVITYGAAIWGVKQFSCINAVHYRAMRFFLGTGKYTPNTAVQGEMGWDPIILMQWKSICNHWTRCLGYDDSRLNGRVFKWAVQKGNSRCKNWPFAVKDKLFSLGLQSYIQLPFSRLQLLDNISKAILDVHLIEWNNDINRISGRNGNGRNKLRTYRIFKDTYQVERYCKMNLPFPHRSALAKFRCGVAPLRLETGRYENLAENNRTCPFCASVIESEKHVLLECPIYSGDRRLLFCKATEVNNNFMTLSEEDKLKFLFTHPTLIRPLAKTCCNILKIRNNTLYSKNIQ